MELKDLPQYWYTDITQETLDYIHEMKKESKWSKANVLIDAGYKYIGHSEIERYHQTCIYKSTEEVEGLTYIPSKEFKGYSKHDENIPHVHILAMDNGVYENRSVVSLILDRKLDYINEEDLQYRISEVFKKIWRGNK